MQSKLYGFGWKDSYLTRGLVIILVWVIIGLASLGLFYAATNSDEGESINVQEKYTLEH